MQVRKSYLILLAVASGVLLSLGWPAGGFPFILFVALVPLLYIEDYIAKNKHNFIKASVFFFAYITFFIWNLLTTWWIVYSTVFGAVMAVVFNSLFMATVFMLYHLVRRTVFKSRGGFYVLVLFWVSFEFLHLDWDLSWSWLNLGNGFAAYPQFIQWYEVTGTFGGCIWILLANILLYKFLLSAVGYYRSKRTSVLLFGAFILLLLVPSVISLTMYNNYHEKGDPYRCLVIQPNIDPYNEKFGGMTPLEQLEIITRLAKSKLNDSTDFMVCPETALAGGIVENEIDEYPEIDSLKSLINSYPNLKIVTGMSSFKIFGVSEKLSTTARYSSAGNYWYDVCNSALYLDSGGTPQIYHKSKLVPGVEKMPFPRLLKPLEKFAIDLGGMTGSHGIQKERSALGPANDEIRVAPVICYESIYGDFVTGYIRNKAGLIFIITNDGWWLDTPGHRQHLQYARLRAVETRRSIARSANTGISAFINQRGDVFQQTPYWAEGAIQMDLNANSKLTFYTRFGDYLGVIAMYLSLAVIIVHIAVLLLNKRKKIKIRKQSRTQ